MSFGHFYGKLSNDTMQSVGSLASYQATALNFLEVRFATDALIVEIPRCHRLRRIRIVVLTQALEILDLVCLVENVFSKTRTLIAVSLRCFYTEMRRKN